MTEDETTGLTQHEQFWWLCEPLFIVSNMAIKASIGIMLIRLTVSNTQRYILYVNIAVTQIYSFFFFFIFLFQCYPLVEHKLEDGRTGLTQFE
jgi:hypothetical protein